MQPVTISRRRLLGTAGAAGLAAGGARWLPTGTPSPPPRRPPAATTTLPAPGRSGIEHVVVVMMENRSFDHFLGWLPGRRRQAGRPDATSTATACRTPTHHLDGVRQLRLPRPRPLLRGRPDPAQRRPLRRLAARRGERRARDRLLRRRPTSRSSARRRRTGRRCDRYFAAVMAETYPNRFYHARGADRPAAQQHRPVARCRRSGTGWPTPGVQRHATTSATSRSPRSGARQVPRRSPQPFAQFLADAAAGHAARGVASSTRGSRTRRRAPRATTTRTPTSAPARHFLNQVYDAVRTGPDWENTVLVINYDEWGGFFDHVAPGTAPDVSPDDRAARLPGAGASSSRRWRAAATSPTASTTTPRSCKMIEWRWGLAAADAARRARPQPRRGARLRAAADARRADVHRAAVRRRRLRRRRRGEPGPSTPSGRRCKQARPRSTDGAPAMTARRPAAALALAGRRRSRSPSRSPAPGRDRGPAPPARRRRRARRAASAYVPPVGHVFVINIENKGYDETWGPAPRRRTSPGRCARKGVLLNTYYGTAHNSQPNYVAQISGQGPNPHMQADCQVFSPFVGTGTAAPGQAVGTGCVFPATVPTPAAPADRARAELEGLHGGHGHALPAPGARRARTPRSRPRPGDQYAARHNPFMYFRSIIDRPPYCAAPRRRPAGALTHRPAARARPPRTSSYITPDLCHDGHDAPCADGRPGRPGRGQRVDEDRGCRGSSPRRPSGSDGVLVITADESDSPQSDATACCGEGARPEHAAARASSGPGGGRIGALVISRWTAAEHLEHHAVQPLLAARPRSRTSSGCPSSATPAPPGSTPVRARRLQQRLEQLAEQRRHGPGQQAGAPGQPLLGVGQRHRPQPGVDAQPAQRLGLPAAGAVARPTAAAVSSVSRPRTRSRRVRPARLVVRDAVADVAAGPGQPGAAVEPDRGAPVARDAERRRPRRG